MNIVWKLDQLKGAPCEHCEKQGTATTTKKDARKSPANFLKPLQSLAWKLSIWKERGKAIFVEFSFKMNKKVILSSVLNGISDIHQCYEMLFITIFTNYQYLTSKFIVVITAHNALVKI